MASRQSSITRGGDSHSRTRSSARSSEMPSSKASSPRKPAAGFGAAGELERSPAVIAEGLEGAHQEVAVRKRLAHLHRAVPGGQHRDVMLAELGDGLRVVLLELVVRNLVDPGAHRLAEQLAAGLTADGVGHRSDGVGWVYEAECHLGAASCTPDLRPT